MRGSEIPKIVATLGPASMELARELWNTGATAFRLNSSHLSAERLEAHVRKIREALPECPVVVDLQGAKMRVGVFIEREVRAGEAIRFTTRGADGAIPLPHPEIFESVSTGETIGCDDDRLRFRVTSIGAGFLEAVVLTGGLLQPRKGVNVIEHPVALHDMCAADIDCIRATAALGCISFAFSFMRDGSETAWIRRRAPDCRVIGKIERREAASNIDRIAAAVDEIWICRGDLGAQLGPGGMARWISAFDPRTLPVPVLMAGQVLEHLTRHSSPTRAEVCHLYDLVTRGYSGFILSDETAIGVDPARAVSTLRSLLEDFSSGIQA